MDVIMKDALGGDNETGEMITLREIANEARERMMQERMEWMEKKIETLTTILHELRDEQRRDYETTAMRDEAIAESSHQRRRLEEIPPLGEQPHGVHPYRSAIRIPEEHVDEGRDQSCFGRVAAHDPDRALELEEEVRRLAQAKRDIEIEEEKTAMIKSEQLEELRRKEKRISTGIQLIDQSLAYKQYTSLKVSMKELYDRIEGRDLLYPPAPVEDLVRNRYLDEYVDEAFSVIKSQYTMGDGAERSLEREQPTIRVIAGGPTLAGDSNSAFYFAGRQESKGIDPGMACHKLAIKKGARLVRQKMRCFNQERYEAINAEVEKLLQAGFIREAKYPKWISNVVLVKKANGKWRMCVDFTDLNNACPKDGFPLPKIDQLVDSTAGHSLLSFIDAFSRYNQIPMDKHDEESTTFITNMGLFCNRVMPFGLKNAGATYQRLVNKIFKPLIGQTMEVYVDDMIMKSREPADHVQHLEENFDLLRKYRIKLNPEKCAFGVSSGKFLGFLVSHQGIKANPKKIRAVIEQSRSKALVDAETRYPAIEKWALALVTVARKLRPYFQAHSIIVMTDQPLRLTLLKPEASGRLMKWSVELSEFDITYRPRRAVKAQALADFVVDCTEPKEGVQRKQLVEQEKLEGVWLVMVYGSRSEQGSRAGVVIRSPEGAKVSYVMKFEFQLMNNQAEYEAFITGLGLAHALRAKMVEIRADSQLVCNQLNEQFQARGKKMKLYLKKAKQMIGLFREVEVKQIAKTENYRADMLARMAAIANPKLPKTVPLKVRTSPSIGNEIKVMGVDTKKS
ncbi:hypothetical protein KPL70_014547 [Citrus sinensis]|nr:hypothetical protein KPL70_014547 [Citrus sinensis]